MSWILTHSTHNFKHNSQIFQKLSRFVSELSEKIHFVPQKTKPYVGRKHLKFLGA